MVSGCAIMGLVDRMRVTGVEVQSYGTDAALLEDLRASWPEAVAATAEVEGYRSIDVASQALAGAVRLTDRLGVALAAEAGGSFASVPIAREEYGGPWRRARAGDGLSAFVAGVPEASERAIGVDQTHESVVVGERAILKWFRRVGPGPSRAAILVAHLDTNGFEGIPEPLGSLAWQSPSGVGLVLGQGDAYLPDARDGWEWVVERCEVGDASVGRELGELITGLHRSLASPSRIIADPVATARPDAIDGWRGRALATLEEAVTLTADTGLASWAPAMQRSIEALASVRSAELQPVHGDLHVGQVLAWSGGLAVIDFDGNPTLGDTANEIRQPRERDLAQLVTSLDHVGRVVEERGGGDRAGWIGESRAAFLEAAGPHDEVLLAAFEIEQECRELVYAARFLPRWRYAPMATLRTRFG
jgi:maltokinase